MAGMMRDISIHATTPTFTKFNDSSGAEKFQKNDATA